MGIVNVTLSVKVAPFTEVSAVEFAVKMPRVILEEVITGGSKITLISFGWELNVMTVVPTVRVLPPPPTVPPELPAPNVPVVLALKVIGAADTETIPKERRVNAPSSLSVGRFSNRIIIVTPDIKWIEENF